MPPKVRLQTGRVSLLVEGADIPAEFYNTSQYGREYVIGRNCRFLQGPKTSNATVKRLIDALANGQEICETILNYRRDGSPFMNLLLIAPLYDNKGHVRYFLGCQIDVSSLVEGGRGLESFADLLKHDRTESRFGGRPDKDPKHVLGELGQMLNEEESDIVKNKARRYSDTSKTAAPQSSGTTRKPRRILGMEDADRTLWPDASLGPSGRLPGVYQNVSAMVLGVAECVLTESAVSPGPTLPISAYHLHFSCPSNTRPFANEVP